MANDIQAALWSDQIASGDYEGGGERYRAAILEQYKLYVEMADRISNRRGLTNPFLTLNTAVFTTIGVFWKERPDVSPWPTRDWRGRARWSVV